MAFFIKGIATMTPLKTEIVRARVSHELKQSAEQVFDDLGMSMTEAIRLFLTQVSLRQEFPIELKIPNKMTLEAMKENVTEKTYDSVDDLFNEVLGDAQH